MAGTLVKLVMVSLGRVLIPRLSSPSILPGRVIALHRIVSLINPRRAVLSLLPVPAAVRVVVVAVSPRPIGVVPIRVTLLPRTLVVVRSPLLVVRVRLSMSKLVILPSVRTTPFVLVLSPVVVKVPLATIVRSIVII